MGSRSLGRERAMQALYQLEIAPGDPAVALETVWAASSDEGKPDPAAKQFALELVTGVLQHMAELDQVIESQSRNWRLERMSRIDRNVLRLGVFELKHRPDIPAKVTLNEAIELGKRFGTEESSAFINGLLDKVALAVKKR